MNNRNAVDAIAALKSVSNETILELSKREGAVEVTGIYGPFNSRVKSVIADIESGIATPILGSTDTFFVKILFRVITENEEGLLEQEVSIVTFALGE